MGVIIGWIVLLGPILWFFYCRRRYEIATTQLMQALASWEEELSLARNRAVRRYQEDIPNHRIHTDEVALAEPLLEHVQQLIDKLLAAPLRVRLGKSWIRECNSLEERCDKAAHDLQDSAFWAQFPAGSAAAEARFRVGSIKAK